MKELKAFYEKQVEKLRMEHDAWVKSNWKMRSIELALSQIKTEGDTDITAAEEVLRAEYEKERAKNEKSTAHMYNLREFVREIETEAMTEYGQTWEGVHEVFGY